MSIVLLPNSSGYYATTYSVSGGSMASGYTLANSIAGGRQGSMSARTESITADITFSYEFSSFAWTHLFLGRADKIATCLTPLNTKVRQTISGSTNDLSGSAITPLTSANLIGVDKFQIGYGQDYVYKASARQTGLTSAKFVTSRNSGSDPACARMFSHLYFSDAFTFGGFDPSNRGKFEWTDLGSEDRMFMPLKGYFPYETEAKTTITWMGLTRANLTSFFAIPKLLEWPHVLYDETADNIPWKLEHVLIENYQISAQAPDAIQLDISFRRLAHYR